MRVAAESPRARHYAINTLLGIGPAQAGRYIVVGLSRFELLTPRLSSVCSNQLSYRPKPTESLHRVKEPGFPVLSKLDRTCSRSAVYQIDRFKNIDARSAAL